MRNDYGDYVEVNYEVAQVAETSNNYGDYDEVNYGVPHDTKMEMTMVTTIR